MELLFNQQPEEQLDKIFKEQFRYRSSDFPKEDYADYESLYDGPSAYHVNYCGYEDCKPGHKFGPFTRFSYLIHVVFSGKGTFTVNDRTFHLSKGQLFLITPEVMTTYQADLEDPWSYGWVGFTGYNIRSVITRLGFTPSMPVISVENLEPLGQCINNMMETHKLTFANQLYRSAELLRFFACIVENNTNKVSDSPGYSRSQYAQVAMRYLSNNYMKKIKISDLADYIGLDRSHLTKIFQEEYHMSMKEYLLRLRMEKAVHFLLSTDQSITTIAANLGYADGFAFSKQFRQRMGCSPSEYRIKHEKDKDSVLEAAVVFNKNHEFL